MIYVDTSAWFAGSVTTYQNYQVAKAIFESADPRQLVTTDYVVDECLTLMKARSENARALEFGRSVLEESVCRLIWVERDDVFKAWESFNHIATELGVLPIVLVALL